MSQNGKVKIAVFSLTGCEGCSLQILNCEDEIVDLLGHVEIVNFREAMTERSDDYQIAFIDGAVSTPRDVEEVKHWRQVAQLLVPIGACACTGGVNALKNLMNLSEAKKIVYGDGAKYFETIEAQPVSAIVPVDYEIPGCPISSEEFVEVVKALLTGKKPPIPDYPVCVECKLRGTVCMYHRNEVCLGPIARGGCKAICPAYGGRCVACRGLVSEPNLDAAKEVLAEHGMTVHQLLEEFKLYNANYDYARQA